MVDRAFLRPRSVVDPPQGDFQYLPLVRAYEDTTMAGLNNQLDVDFGINAQSVTEFWVIEEIEYEIVVTKPAVGMNPAELLYSCMVWATQAIRV